MDVSNQTREVDRRRHARIVRDLYAVYAMDGPFREGLCITENISAAGLLFRSQDPFRIGTELNLNIHLPNHINPIPCQAQVVRTDPLEAENLYEVGLSFTRMTPDDKRELISSLLTQNDLSLFL